MADPEERADENKVHRLRSLLNEDISSAPTSQRDIKERLAELARRTDQVDLSQLTGTDSNFGETSKVEGTVGESIEGAAVDAPVTPTVTSDLGDVRQEIDVEISEFIEHVRAINAELSDRRVSGADELGLVVATCDGNGNFLHIAINASEMNSSTELSKRLATAIVSARGSLRDLQNAYRSQMLPEMDDPPEDTWQDLEDLVSLSFEDFPGSWAARNEIAESLEGLRRILKAERDHRNRRFVRDIGTRIGRVSVDGAFQNLEITFISNVLRDVKPERLSGQVVATLNLIEADISQDRGELFAAFRIGEGTGLDLLNRIGEN